METRLELLHGELERLHNLYEQHFAGVLKRVPEAEHKRFLANFHAIKPGDLLTTAGKFRFQGLQQKYIQFSNLWGKVLKQIEEGTYHRDIFLMQKKAQSADKKESAIQKPAVSTTKTDPKFSKTLEALYEKMKEMVGNEQKTPPKQEFLSALQKQIHEHKKQNPDRKVELKLNRDSNGRIQIKLGFQRTPSKT